MSRSWRSLWRRECAASVPDYRILVPDSVPDSVLRAWSARGYRVGAGTAGQPSLRGAMASRLMNRNIIRSNVSFTSWTAAGATGTALFGLPTAVLSLASGGLFEVGAVATGLAAAATAGVSGVTGYKYLRDPKRLRRRDREAAGRARWITPALLGWRPGPGGQDTDEQRLFQLAVATARRIVATRAWSHPVLADHVARVDLDHAVASIGVRLSELLELRAELERVREPHTAKQIDVYREKLAQAFGSMAGRVVAMHEYYGRLTDLDRQLTVLEHTEASRALGDRVLDVLSHTADDESADWRFRELNIEAESHGDAIRGLLGELEASAGEFDGLDDLDRRLAAAQRETGGSHAAGTRPVRGAASPHASAGERPAPEVERPARQGER
ncbi:hypothetical protein [Brevibacterium rongguiense]|uniref:hypothetical protein n=1 Tax=Brevibacterium rongguiense TaxID=2695267 RepID=UPI0019254D33|nr:hypothetical protein [Brevibacterium rongguiense]